MTTDLAQISQRPPIYHRLVRDLPDSRRSELRLGLRLWQIGYAFWTGLPTAQFILVLQVAGRGILATMVGGWVKYLQAKYALLLSAVWLCSAVALSGCITDKPTPDTQEGVPPITTATIQENASVQYYPSDEPLRLGLEHFNRGDFGIAERYFRDAVEKAPKDVSAWIGLAASYDRLGRF